MLRLNVPGAGDLLLDHLVLDVNGTLSSRGKAIDGVIPAVRALHGVLQPHVVSADTFGTAQALAVELGAPFRRICTGADKRAYVRMLGAQSCVAIGNGRNDARMLSEAALGIAVLGPEGTHTAAMLAADIVTRSAIGALMLLADQQALLATLRP